MTKPKATNTLQAMLDRAAAQTAESAARPAGTAAKENDGAESAASAKAAPRGRKPTPTTRTGTKYIGGHFAPEIGVQLRVIAAEDGTTVQALLEEAIDDLLRKKGGSKLRR